MTERKEELIVLAEAKGAKPFKNIKYSYYLYLCILQQWLRDMHGMDAFVEPLVQGNSRITNCYGSNLVFSKAVDEHGAYKDTDIFTTYEEALEDAVLEGLKEI